MYEIFEVFTKYGQTFYGTSPHLSYSTTDTFDSVIIESYERHVSVRGPVAYYREK